MISRFVCAFKHGFPSSVADQDTGGKPEEKERNVVAPKKEGGRERNESSGGEKSGGDLQRRKVSFAITNEPSLLLRVLFFILDHLLPTRIFPPRHGHPFPDFSFPFFLSSSFVTLHCRFYCAPTTSPRKYSFFSSSSSRRITPRDLMLLNGLNAGEERRAGILTRPFNPLARTQGPETGEKRGEELRAEHRGPAGRDGLALLPTSVHSLPPLHFSHFTPSNRSNRTSPRASFTFPKI